MLIGSLTFAKSQTSEVLNSNKIENPENALKISFNLGDLSTLNETELNNLLNNLPKLDFNSDKFSECTITYSATFTYMGVSLSVTASGTAETCAAAGNIARSGISNEVGKAKALIASIF